MRIDVIFPHELAPGWAPLWAFARLAADIFGGQLLDLPENPTKLQRALNFRPRPRATDGSVLIAFLHNPRDVHALRASKAFRSGYDQVVAWIVDGFQHEQILPAIGHQGIDIVGYMRPNDESAFRRAVGNRALLLGWGADVLNSGSGDPHRDIDLLRIGRQPDVWDDDDRTAAACTEVGLRFHGRPAFFEDNPESNQTEVMSKLRRSRFALAHSNLAAPAPYTHQTEEYITARWVDALACGNVVAGIAPHRDQSMARLFWPEATLDFDRIDLRHNLAAIRAARDAWTPVVAAHNYRQALLRLDWRWRLKAIADRLMISVPKLDAELDRIEKLAAVTPARS